MNSIDDRDARRSLSALFDEAIAPLAEEAQRSGIAPFPLRPDPKLHTYYTSRRKTSMRREDFTAPSCIDFDDLERRLTAQWRTAERAELAHLAQRFTATARAAYATDSPDPDVSPFMYVMF